MTPTPSMIPTVKPRRLLVTSALPYANGDIHIGHLMEYIQTDVWCRFQRLRGHECVYVCADDTHGTPIMVRARSLGIEPEALIAKSHEEHTRDFAGFGIGFDIFSSTNSEENRILAEEFYIKMRDKGHTDVRQIQQLFCDHDKMFLPDRFVRGTCPNCASADQYGDSCDVCSATYSPMDLKNPKCAICGTTPITKGSDHIFVKLNDFKEFLKTWMPEHTTKDVSLKLTEWFEGDLRDWDISRDAPYFGFEIPGFKGKYFYVWVDAPIGYVSSTMQWCKKNGRDFNSFWKSPDTEIYHFIGKDITYFHLLFWPALLKAAEYNLPKQVCVHGHLTVNGEKMSKSKGTSIKALTYLKHLDPMYLRFYYASKLSGTVNDLDLNVTDFVNRVNSDLVGKITNLGSRGAQMLKKRIDGRLGPLKADGAKLIHEAQARAESIAEHYENRDFAKAMTEIREIADAANKYFDDLAPWNLIKTDVEGTRSALTTTLNLFRLISIYLKPVLPEFSDKVAKLMNEKPYAWTDLAKVLESGEINEYEHLAVRVETAKFDQIIEESKVVENKPAATPALASTTANATGTSAPASSAAPKAAAPAAGATPTEIDFEDFAKVDLRVAKIIHAEEIKEADKLLRLKVDIGELGERQIIAGIKAAYKAEDLIGRLVVVVANLKPRKMKFGMSEGMVVAAGEGGSDLFVMSPDTGAKPGQKVK